MTPVAQRVQKRRDALRKAGLRPIQIWVPDTSASGFDEECRRQARLVAQADGQDTEFPTFLDAAVAGLEGWA